MAAPTHKGHTMTKRKDIRVTIPARHIADFDEAKARAENLWGLKLSDAQYASRLLSGAVSRALAEPELKREDIVRLLGPLVGGEYDPKDDETLKAYLAQVRKFASERQIAALDRAFAELSGGEA